MIIYTIGHSNRKISDFISILKKFNVELLVDIRTFPFSKYVPDYNKENISRSLKENCIEYLYKGDRLGGMPPEGFNTSLKKERYNEAWHELLGGIVGNQQPGAEISSEKD